MATKKPSIVEDSHLEFLDELQASGKTNMYGASPYLQEKYPELDSEQVGEIVGYWMDSFSERHPQ